MTSAHLLYQSICESIYILCFANAGISYLWPSSAGKLVLWMVISHLLTVLNLYHSMYYILYYYCFIVLTGKKMTGIYRKININTDGLLTLL